MDKRSLLFGLGGGLLFFAHAMINNSHAWPLIWPFLAGALAVWTSPSGGRGSYGADIGKAALVGLLAAAIFIAATAAALSQLGLVGNIGFTGLILAAVVGLVGAMLGGALAHPLARRT